MERWLKVALVAWPICASFGASVAKAQPRADDRRQAIPLPPKRPANLQPKSLRMEERAPTTTPDAAAPKGASDCLSQFAERGGLALQAEAASANAACAIEDPVTFRTIALSDGSKVELDAAITLRCALAVELLDWVRKDLTAVVAGGVKLARLTGVAGAACRPRNGVAGAVMSEHATGNAVDLVGLAFSDGRKVSLTTADVAMRGLRQAFQASACRRFTTVLGPGSDGSHRDHVHLDLRKRPGDHRICQWTVE